MAKRLVHVTVCDRCPVNKRKPATHPAVPFGFGENRWKIALCDQHYEMLSRDMYAWGLLATEVEEDAIASRRFHPSNGAEMRRLAELRTRQAAEDREIALAARDFSVAATGAQVVAGLGAKTLLSPIPHDHKDWYFTQHALDRMAERDVDPIDILWACSKPKLSYSGREPGLMVHELENGTKAVVNPSTKTIITVAIKDDADDRKAVGQ